MRLWDYGLIAALSRYSATDVMPIYALRGDGIGFELEGVQRVGDYKRRVEFNLLVRYSECDYAKMHVIVERLCALENMYLSDNTGMPIGKIRCKNIKKSYESGCFRLFFIGLIEIDRKSLMRQETSDVCQPPLSENIQKCVAGELRHVVRVEQKNSTHQYSSKDNTSHVLNIT